jgi:hypothetical protein
MSRRREARERQIAATYPCAERCGRVADYRVELRRLEPKRKVTVAGVTKIVEPYVTEYLCAGCCTARVASDDPPRLVEPLKHKALQLAADASTERARVKAERKAAGGGLLDGWGGADVRHDSDRLGLALMAAGFVAYLTVAVVHLGDHRPVVIPGAVTVQTIAPPVPFEQEP